MATVFTSGTWVAQAGSEAAFVERWGGFLEWTTGGFEGLRWAVLLASSQDARHFISLAEWESPAHRDAWRGHADFPAQLGACRELCDEFRAGDYSPAATAGAEAVVPRPGTAGG